MIQINKIKERKENEEKGKIQTKKKNGGPTGWYNNVVGGSIPPVPAREK
jgi:hypothetical protein